jgi:REP element-mobilizing transposase RayT
MPRPTRVHVPGALCLVTCRAAEGTRLFDDAKDYEAYEALLQEYHARFGFKLYAYTLLPDELSLCLEPAADTTVSTIMHAISSRYTKYVIKRHGRTGHVFQERFRLTLIEKAPWLLRLTGYLHTLPRRSGVTTDVTGYRWSSCPSYLTAGESRPGLSLRGEVAEVLELLGREKPGWTYAIYLASVPESEWSQAQATCEQPVVGSPEFLAIVEQRRTSTRCQAPRKAGKVPDTDAGQGGAAPAARPSGRTLSFSISMGTAALALAAALLSTRNVDFLRQTLHMLAEEHSDTLLALGAFQSSRTSVDVASARTPDRLRGSLWQIQLKPVIGSNGSEMVSDRLRFDSEKLVSLQLKQAGFPASAFLEKRSGTGAGSWETVQIGPGGETVSWRGEWNGRAMHGIMTRQMPGQPAQTYRFVGTHLQPDGTMSRREI